MLPLIIVASMLLAGCAHNKIISSANSTDMLYNRQWNLSELTGQAVPASSKANLLFSAGEAITVSGNAGCNRMNGKIELSGNNSIKFWPLATTKMACTNDSINQLESKFLTALAQVDSWKITGDELLLNNGGNVVAKLNAKALTAQQSKLNGTWELNYLSGAKIALDGLFPNKKPRLIFNLPDTQLSGFGGCNGFGSKIKVDGNHISFGDPLSTMMACEGNGEPVFFQTLKKITSYSVTDDNTLALLMGDIALMRFVRK